MYKARIIFLLVTLSLLEIDSRCFWAYRMQVPFFKPGEIIYRYYPQLKAMEEPEPRDRDGYYDILLLGASTLNNAWGNIEGTLSCKLEGRLGRKIRIFNFSKPAFSSRDSYLMYDRLRHRKFDLVLLYDGINDLRANNCPHSFFKDDYSMYYWYDEINIFLAHKEINFLTLPYSLHTLGSKIWAKCTSSQVTTHLPKEEWVRYGCEIKTKECFKSNIEKIVDIAGGKKEHLVLMTFAYYIPHNYSLQMFQGKVLDYGRHQCPVEYWGKPECVARGMTVHNEVIKDIARRHGQALFVDQDGLIPKNGFYFDDVCHLTDNGCERFVNNLLDGIGQNVS